MTSLDLQQFEVIIPRLEVQVSQEVKFPPVINGSIIWLLFEFRQIDGCSDNNTFNAC